MRNEFSTGRNILELVPKLKEQLDSHGKGSTVVPPQPVELVTPAFSYLGEPLAPSRGIPRTDHTEKQTQRPQPTPLGRTVPQEVRRRQMRRPTPESRGRR